MAMMNRGRVFRTWGDIRGGTLKGQMLVVCCYEEVDMGIGGSRMLLCLGRRTVVMRGLVGAPVVPRHLWVGG
jgi:hypothetical protein